MTEQSNIRLKRGRPIHALGTPAKKDHLFRDNESLCGTYQWSGGRIIDPNGLTNTTELCEDCFQHADTMTRHNND